MSLELVLI